ncbi:unnamed protein product [Auanema sp. JU1783]|nr:unnamed protein product [Auanema sp. JU1783]
MPAPKKNRRGRKKKEDVSIVKKITKKGSDQPMKRRGRKKKNNPDPLVIVPANTVPIPVTLDDNIDCDVLNHSRLFNFQKRKTTCSAILTKYCNDVRSSLDSNSFSSNEISNINATIKSIDDFLKNWNNFTLQVVDVLKDSTDELIQKTVRECSNLVTSEPKRL